MAKRGFQRTQSSADERVTSVDELMQLIRSFVDGSDGRCYLRGLPKLYETNLLPSIGRKHCFLGIARVFTAENEEQLLSRFRRHAFSQWNRIPTEWEALFLGRHHGLPVRLLDWTSNPLVALYFACEYGSPDKVESDGVIWAIRRRADEEHDLKILDNAPSPLKVKGIKLVYPFYPSARMTAQSGIFTIQEDPWTALENLANHRFKEEDLDIVELTSWAVAKEKKGTIIAELERLGINRRTLFPDLDGLAHGLWQTAILREAGYFGQ